MSKTLYKEKAVHSCPDGWSCIECGEEFSENTIDVKDYYVNYCSDGTICFTCEKKEIKDEC